MPVPYNPFDVAFHADPYPNYAWLRAYHPVFMNEYGARGEWLLTRYADVATALRDARLSSEVVPASLVDHLGRSGQPLLANLARVFVHMMVLIDDPRHSRLRSR